MRTFYNLSILFFSFFLFSCDKEDAEPASEITISHITLAETYAVGENHEINLTIVKPTPCHIIEKENATVSGNIHSYYFRLLNPASFCIQVLARDESVSINFEPAGPGEHTLRFYINNELYETRTVLAID